MPLIHPNLFGISSQEQDKVKTKITTTVGGVCMSFSRCGDHWGHERSCMSGQIMATVVVTTVGASSECGTLVGLYIWCLTNVQCVGEGKGGQTKTPSLE